MWAGERQKSFHPADFQKQDSFIWPLFCEKAKNGKIKGL